MVNWPYVWRAANAAVEDGSLSATWSPTSAGRATRGRWTAPRAARRSAGSISASPLVPAPELALDAARCITSTENQTFYFLHDGNPAARAEVFSDPEVLEAFPMAPLLLESLKASAPRPRTEFYGDVSAALQREFHPPDAVTSSTPAAASAFISEMLRGDALL